MPHHERLVLQHVALMPGRVISMTSHGEDQLLVTYERDRRWWQVWKPRSWVETKGFVMQRCDGGRTAVTGRLEHLVTIKRETME